MATDMIITLMNTLLSATGVGDLIGCNVFDFLLFLIIVTNFTFLITSINKVIPIAFLLRHSLIMKPWVSTIAGIGYCAF